MSSKLKRILLFLFVAVWLIISFFPFGRKLMINLSEKLNIQTVSDIAAKDELKVHFIDVGQADAILIEQNGEYMLIDGGSYRTKEYLLAYLESYDVTELKAIVSTHPDADHFGGLEYVFDNIKTDELIMSESSEYCEDEDYLKVLNKACEKGTELHTVYKNDVFNLGDVQFTVLAPAFIYDEENSMSLVLRLSYNNSSFLFTGDMTLEEFEDVSDENLQADILKVSHHGSKTGTDNTFLDAVKPLFAVISVGANYYNHPDPSVLGTLDDFNVQTFSTYDSGTIIFMTDGSGKYSVLTER